MPLSIEAQAYEQRKALHSFLDLSTFAPDPERFIAAGERLYGWTPRIPLPISVRRPVGFSGRFS